MKQTIKKMKTQAVSHYEKNEDSQTSRIILDEKQLLRMSRFAARNLSKSWKYFMSRKKADMLIQKITEVLNNENYKAQAVLIQGNYGIRFEGRRQPTIDSVQRVIALTLVRTSVFALDTDISLSKMRIARHIEQLPDFLSRSLVFDLDGVENGVMASRNSINKLLKPLPRLQ